MVHDTEKSKSALIHQMMVESESGGGAGERREGNLLLAEPKVKTKRPPLFKVVLMNDDFTPMDFVVFILKDIFRKNHEEAVSIMMEVHQKGEGICGVFTRDVAETKAELVITLARRNEYPLQCRVEKE
jgi:ATP-dependent Clp protease adaptor protein ClpS